MPGTRQTATIPWAHSNYEPKGTPTLESAHNASPLLSATTMSSPTDRPPIAPKMTGSPIKPTHDQTVVLYIVSVQTSAPSLEA